MPNVGTLQTPAVNWYDNIEYASGRLSGTIVRRRERLCYIEHIDGDGDVSYRYIRPKPETPTITASMSARLSTFDVTPFPLGFTLYNDQAFYVYRRAARRYRQGLCFDNVNGLENLRSLDMGRLDMWTAIAMPYYREYPSLSEALEMVEDVYTSVPVSREFCVTDQGKVLYRASRDPVGEINLDSGAIMLYNKYFYLNEILHEEGVFPHVTEAEAA